MDLGTAQHPLKVAVVGSGPSGFYATEALVKTGKVVEVNMLERLPVPYGLVRNGVAPDHPKLKQAIKVYAGIAESPGFHYFGNVAVGRDLSIDELRRTHHAVVLTYGAETDRRLGIPGEDLPGSHTATEFVGWYNGHPDYRDRTFDFSHEQAVVIGQGNVAADVARILAKTVDELRSTDIAEHALSALAESSIKTIYVIGRRGPAQAKFTSKEVREFGELVACDPFVDKSELVLNPESESELAEKSNAGAAKVYELFKEFTERPPGAKTRRAVFTFLKSPREIIGESRVEKVILERNSLSGEAFAQSARGTGEMLELQAGLLFRSIGYHGVAMPGVPFDERRGVIPNDEGRVLDSGSAVQGLYAAGWIKRGPTGIIGTNRADSVGTINSLLKDAAGWPPDKGKRGAEAISQLLNERGIRYVSFDDWKIIDQAEIERGRPLGKPREKFTLVSEMLDLLV